MPMDIDPAAAVSAAAKHPATAGLFGSLIALKFAPGAGWIERVTNVAAGTVCAAYLAPWLAEFMGVASAQGIAALSFGVGLFGLSLAAAIAQGIRDKGFDLIAGWLPGKKG